MRILYYSMVDWKWIKQRPHFLTIYFNRHNIKTDYAFPRIIGREQLVKTGFVINQDHEQILKHPIRQLPKEKECHLIFELNEFLRKIQFVHINKKMSYDFVIITNPTLVTVIPEDRTFKLVYEMMDDYSEFANLDKRTNYLELESRICSLTDQIVTSSFNLKRLLLKRYSLNPDKIVVVPNAYDPFSMSESKSLDVPSSRKGKTDRLLSYFNDESGRYDRSLVYIGTISQWMDSRSIISYAEDHPNDVILLIGPIENLPDPVLKELKMYHNIKLTGPVEHTEVGMLIRLGSVMLIPFQVTRLIESVDPVKMYEYIFFKKPIVSSYWLELNRFEPFVSFYDPELPGSFGKAVQSSLEKNVDDAQYTDFIQQNDWDARVRQYETLLNER